MTKLLRVSPVVVADNWKAIAQLREESRARGVEGLMLKQRASMYGVGRTNASGTWWKWKIDPYSIDAVLVYAQRGHGRRASLFTDYTFAVWDEAGGVRTLVPFAKAYSGLTDEEIRRVDAIVRKTTIERFGPVHRVTPTLVFEIGFKGIQVSPRHKSGIAVRFPRMLRWRTDKSVEDAQTGPHQQPESLDTCRRCTLWQDATHAVPGAGSARHPDAGGRAARGP